MNTIKKGLGRGLSSLIGETRVETTTNKLSLHEIIPKSPVKRNNLNKCIFRPLKKP